jgi:hypothetical protein
MKRALELASKLVMAEKKLGVISGAKSSYRRLIDQDMASLR